MTQSFAARPSASHVARLVLTAFLMTFLVARIVVMLIMTHRIPDLYLFVGQTHVHHLNYGIFLLTFVGAYLLFWKPDGSRMRMVSICYGLGLALTFDEFGMWLHLGGGYWQRASFDAVVIIAAILALISVSPTIGKFCPRHWIASFIALILLVALGSLVADYMKHGGKGVAPYFQRMEMEGPK
jgi:hypothetical protein